MGRLGFALRCFWRALTDPAFAGVVAKSAEPTGQTPKAVDQPKEALQLLAFFQDEGRWIDFLVEDISAFSDEQVGAAARNIHAGCRKALKKLFEITPVLEGEEGEEVTVPKGFSPTSIKLVGQVAGTPPFKGIVRHHGWKVSRAEFPPKNQDPHILAQAEVEIL